MALFGNGVDKAMAEVKRLAAARLDFEDREEKARAELASIERLSSSGHLETLLDPGNEAIGALMSQRGKRQAQLEDELRSLELAKPQVLKRLELAMVAVNAAKGAEIRKQAEKLQRELDAHVAERDRLKSALEKHEECGFVAASYRIADTPAGFQRREILQSPKSVLLANRIAALLAEALKSESTPVNQGWTLSVESTLHEPGYDFLEELLVTVERMTGENTIAPTRRMAEAWYRNQGRPAAEAEWAKLVPNFPNQVLEFDESITLAWGPNGVIVDASNVIFRQRVSWKRVPGIMSSSFA